MRTDELPRVFRAEAIDPETSAYNAQLAAIRATTPKVYDVGAVRMREIRHRQWLAEGGPSSLAADRTIPGPAGDIGIKNFRKLCRSVRRHGY